MIKYQIPGTSITNLVDKYVRDFDYYINVNADQDMAYGTVAMGVLKLTTTVLLPKTTIVWLYSDADNSLICKTWVVSSTKDRGLYTYTCCDYGCKLTTEERTETYVYEDGFAIADPINDTMVKQTYRDSAVSFDESNFFDLYVATYTKTAVLDGNTFTYTPMTIYLPQFIAIEVGQKFAVTADGNTYYGYVMELEYTLEKTVIRCNGTDEDNTLTFEEKTDNSITQIVYEEGQLSTRIQATENWITGTGTTTVNNLSTLTQTVNGITGTVQSNNQWISNTGSTLVTDVGSLSIWSTGIQSDVSHLQEEIGTTGTTGTILYNISENTSAIQQNATDIQARVETTTWSTVVPTGTQTELNGKIDKTGTLTKTGMSWNLSSDDWTVNKITGGGTTQVLKVDANGLHVNGDGTFTGTVNASAGQIADVLITGGKLVGQFSTDTDAVIQAQYIVSDTVVSSSELNPTYVSVGGTLYKKDQLLHQHNSVYTIDSEGGIAFAGSYMKLSSAMYGSTLPTGVPTGTLFFKT